MTEILLKLENVGFSYEDKENVLSNISFSVEKEQTLGIIGPNGAGKTTLFMTICGVMPISTGTIKINDEQIQPGKFHPAIGYLFQNPDDQLFSPCVWDDVAFGPSNMGLKGKELHEKVDHSLELCGCPELGQRPSQHLSGGEKRMVALACVIALDPEIIIFDEPSSNLDMRARRKLINLIRRSGKTNIIASHDLELILEICNSVILIDNGKIVAQGKTDKIMSDQQIMEKSGLEVPHSLRNK